MQHSLMYNVTKSRRSTENKYGFMAAMHIHTDIHSFAKYLTSILSTETSWNVALLHYHFTV